MEIFKFGGASVKDAASVKNVLTVLQKTGFQDKVIVISAMGKMTNAFEIVIAEYLSSRDIPGKSLSAIKEYHLDLAHQLFELNQSSVFEKIDVFFRELTNFMKHNKSVQYDFVYDQMVCFGELLSTTIVSEYLKLQGVEHIWIDARQFIKTDSTYRDARVNWEETQEKITNGVKPGKLYITQGFIGSDANNFTTTLGREGSDYTAAIFAYCLNAEKVIIWKDVPGVMNADPRMFENPQLLNQISY
ncbi:MAG: aspartate kinase, partial [Gillisia sp.]|nr:aspartate kinase [Gillisia sp.]